MSKANREAGKTSGVCPVPTTPVAAVPDTPESPVPQAMDASEKRKTVIVVGMFVGAVALLVVVFVSYMTSAELAYLAKMRRSTQGGHDATNRTTPRRVTEEPDGRRGTTDDLSDS
ncbi:unnamed protein product [Ixodes persulcatus]